MALNNGMPIRDPKAAVKDSKHTTTYQASRGGFFPPADKPVPGTKKK